MVHLHGDVNGNNWMAICMFNGPQMVHNNDVVAFRYLV